MARKLPAGISASCHPHSHRFMRSVIIFHARTREWTELKGMNGHELNKKHINYSKIYYFHLQQLITITTKPCRCRLHFYCRGVVVLVHTGQPHPQGSVVRIMPGKHLYIGQSTGGTHLGQSFPSIPATKPITSTMVQRYFIVLF